MNSFRKKAKVKYGFKVIKLYSHPCYIGFDEYDHWFKTISDSVGDGVRSMSFTYRQCKNCGLECEAEDESYYDYEDYL